MHLLHLTVTRVVENIRKEKNMNEREKEECRYRIGMWTKLTLTALALLGWIIELKKLGAF